LFFRLRLSSAHHAIQLTHLLPFVFHHHQVISLPHFVPPIIVVPSSPPALWFPQVISLPSFVPPMIVVPSSPPALWSPQVMSPAQLS
jgi:hypothetical protein